MAAPHCCGAAGLRTVHYIERCQAPAENQNPENLTMTPEQILAEIREANLSYLMLAQSLIRSDREQALYRLTDQVLGGRPH